MLGARVGWNILTRHVLYVDHTCVCKFLNKTCSDSPAPLFAGWMVRVADELRGAVVGINRTAFLLETNFI